MIIKKDDGYHVKSSHGKHMGGPYKTRKEAEERLAQVEFFKKVSKGEIKLKPLKK